MKTVTQQSKFYKCPYCGCKMPYVGYPIRGKVLCENCIRPFTGAFNVFTKYGR